MSSARPSARRWGGWRALSTCTWGQLPVAPARPGHTQADGLSLARGGHTFRIRLMRLGATAALRPLRYRSFAVLWTASLVSNIGTWMQTVAVGALVLSRTGQASWAVLAAAGAFLPIGLLSPVGGALADRLPRRPAIAAGNLIEGVIAAVIAWLVGTGHATPYDLLALV